MVEKLHPLLQHMVETPQDKDGCIHEINHNLRVLDELEIKKFTTIKGNNNFLDLVKYADLTEYSIMYCPECKRLTHVIIEGCEGALFFKCEDCEEVIIEAFKHA